MCVRFVLLAEAPLASLVRYACASCVKFLSCLVGVDALLTHQPPCCCARLSLLPSKWPGVTLCTPGRTATGGGMDVQAHCRQCLQFSRLTSAFTLAWSVCFFGCWFSCWGVVSPCHTLSTCIPTNDIVLHGAPCATGTRIIPHASYHTHASHTLATQRLHPALGRCMRRTPHPSTYHVTTIHDHFY